MFGKKPQNQQPVVEQKITLPPKFSQDIRTIPSTFQQSSTKKSNKIFIIVGIIVILLGVVGVSALFVYKSMTSQGNLNADTNQPQENANVNQQPAVNQNNDVNQNTNTNASPTDSAINANTNANVDINANTNADLNVNANPAPSTGSTDADGDQLTLAEEEKIYFTNASNYDTDNDGYLDGAEVTAGFSPIAAKLNLLNSGLVTNYENKDLGFSVWYPNNWLVSQGIISGGAKISFDSKAGEVIIVSVVPKTAGVTLNQWISSDYPNVSLSGLQPVNLKVFSGLMESNGLKYFLQSDKSVNFYMVDYDTGGLSALSFATTFKMMLASLK